MHWLGTTITDSYGVFDKFTGDGILAFFPEFFSGPDAGFLAIRAADNVTESSKDIMTGTGVVLFPS